MIEVERKPDTSIEYLDNEEKITRLMDQYGQEVIMLAYTYVKDKQLAEDIAQEVFIKCYEKLDSFRHESSYKTWIYRITINKCKDVFKSWHYRLLIFTDLIKGKKDIAAQSAEFENVKREENLWVAEMVMSLPLKLREVIILYYFEELKIEEIAEMLEIKLNTVKTRLHRARYVLEKKLKRGDLNGR
ncbi:sigma-70 family RNA polymerase sigma factor [Fredinandcohnia sp. QZ13]|uniref:sigma-70 family RNA polymerase sigma factor n=1 Tax=Fredinandcohnia sp. QZ13 TaxID=3073144 RepID=UPI0028534D8D|nr:sigma-70 family RNA polymerase sigma factor [Fredinandcohnia sp. QZ13]MDR4886028.1 sigma-70 family RNA polymerase sigma factor [Fredinandcohnia sp. QZ13]